MLDRHVGHLLPQCRRLAAFLLQTQRQAVQLRLTLRQLALAALDLAAVRLLAR
jgi:hypothetical protein